MKKKLIISLGVVSFIILIGGVSYAEELEEALKVYLNDPSLDFLGRGYDKILFNNNLTIVEDIKTIPLQMKCIFKMVTQKPNLVAYSTLGWGEGFKAAIGEKAFNKIAMDILKLIIK